MPRSAVFLDRDGVLNVGVHGDYIRSVSQFRWLPGAREAVAALNAAGWPVVVITNQSGIARGMFTVEDLAEVHARMKDDLAACGAHVDAIYYCPHRSEDGCSCRKPLPGMLFQAAEDLDLSLHESILVGDTEIDMQAGRAAGCRVEAVESGLSSRAEILRWSPAPEGVFKSLMEAVKWIDACGAYPS